MKNKTKTKVIAFYLSDKPALGASPIVCNKVVVGYVYGVEAKNDDPPEDYKGGALMNWYEINFQSHNSRRAANRRDLNHV